MLRALKRVGEAVFNAVVWLDETFCDSPAENIARQREYLIRCAVADGRMDASHLLKKRRLAENPDDEAGAAGAQSNSKDPVSKPAPAQERAYVNARDAVNAPPHVTLVHGVGAAVLFNTFTHATSGVRASAIPSSVSDIPSPSAGPAGGHSGAEMYDGEALTQLLNSSADAEIVKEETNGVMWDRGEQIWKHGRFRCRKARRHADHSLRFQMNFTLETAADAASAVVELVHWFSVEDLSYIFDMNQRAASGQEVRDVGMFGHPVV